MKNPAEPVDVTGAVTAKVTLPDPETELTRVTIDSEVYYEWKLTDNITDYRIRFSGLEPGTNYGLEAMAYPDKTSGGTIVKGDFTKVVDAGADNAATHQNVTKENPNYQLETQNSVT